MKKLILLVSISILLFSCRQTRDVTEGYIKNQIQTHKPGETENISIKPIYTWQTPFSDAIYTVEFTGYSYKGTQKLVIGSDRLTIGRGLPVLKETEFAVLTVSECEQVIKEIQKGCDYIWKQKINALETYYIDYTPNEKIFFSIEEKLGERTMVQIWIAERKYSLPYKTLIKKLNKFLEWQSKSTHLF